MDMDTKSYLWRNHGLVEAAGDPYGIYGSDEQKRFDLSH